MKDEQLSPPNQVCKEIYSFSEVTLKVICWRLSLYEKKTTNSVIDGDEQDNGKPFHYFPQEIRSITRKPKVQSFSVRQVLNGQRPLRISGT